MSIYFVIFVFSLELLLFSLVFYILFILFSPADFVRVISKKHVSLVFPKRNPESIRVDL